MKSYKKNELDAMQKLIQNAKILVERDIIDNNIRDEGTCIICGGIEISFIPPRCRKPVRTIIVESPFQGNVSNFKALKNALQYLKDNNVECRYFDGYID